MSYLHAQAAAREKAMLRAREAFAARGLEPTRAELVALADRLYERPRFWSWRPTDLLQSHTGSLGVGSISGIHFDLRHAELDLAAWSPGYMWCTSGPQGGGMLYPWDRETWSAEGSVSLGYSPQHSGDPPLLTVDVGETVRVAAVRTVIEPGYGENPSDTTLRLATLEVVRANGRSETSHYELEFFRVTRLRGAPHFEFADRATERVLQDNGLSDPFDYQDDGADDDERPLGRRAMDHCASTHNEYWLIRENLPLLVQKADGRKEDYSHSLQKLVNEAVAFGYFLAKSESEAASTTVVRIKAGGVKGARASQAKREEKARRTRDQIQSVALDVMRNGAPVGNREALYTEMIAWWPEEYGEMPGRTTVLTALQHPEVATKLKFAEAPSAKRRSA